MDKSAYQGRKTMMIRSARLASVMAIAVALLTACAQLTHLTRTRTWPDASTEHPAAKAVIIDAKQRVISGALVTNETKDSAGNRTGYSQQLRVCAEPSPDALSALAASNGLSLSKGDKLSLGNAFAVSEAAGSIGLRTQSIQLMRDAMYRLCEGYMSGALDAGSFETLHRRFQSSMVAIVAIEQLTGVARAPAVVLGGDALVGNADLVAKYTEKTESSIAAVKDATAAVKAKQAEYDAARKSREDVEGKKTALEKVIAANAGGTPTAQQKTDLDALTAELTKAKTAEAGKLEALEADKSSLARAESQRDSFDAARKAALAGSGNTKASFQIEGGVSAPSQKDLGKIADSVAGIVQDTLELGFARELCATLLEDNSGTQTPTDGHQSAIAVCNNYVKATADDLAAQASWRKSMGDPEVIKRYVDAESQRLDVISECMQSGKSDQTIQMCVAAAGNALNPGVGGIAGTILPPVAPAAVAPQR
jgi:hypothetical protein